MSSLVATIERCAFEAWPAEEVLSVGEWRLRATAGVTRRANSVWTGGADARALSLRELDDRIDAVEAFYRARALPPRFQLSEATPATQLDQRLGERGYALDAPVAVYTADVARVAAMLSESPGRARAEERLSDAWFELSGRSGRYRGAAERAYRGLLDRLGERAAFAIAETPQGTPAAVGLGVPEGEYYGIFSMLTLPAYRRQGYARAILGALSANASARGAKLLYLQLERDNSTAAALYRALGFRELYAVWYRSRVADGL